MFDIVAVPYHAPIQEGGLYNTIVIGFPLTLLKKRANMLPESYAFVRTTLFEKSVYAINKVIIIDIMEGFYCIF